ncbi:MAG: hypothetical protein ACOYJL_08655 [Tractidigestivibacter sp.]|uniref:hypothetical protein n=1 Tax=Tractidigestivibacter sp. TaxID=2847320 RepID=UPI003D94F8A1
MGQAFDVLAEGEELDVLLAVADEAGTVASYTFSDDGAEECLKAARDKARSLARAHGDKSAHLQDPCYYAIAYFGAIADETGAYQDAVILEFGEKGRPAFSAYSLISGRGKGNGFAWTDPAPAGEVENLLDPSIR